jgi:4'-phosphopantetheinyl transferase
MPLLTEGSFDAVRFKVWKMDESDSFYLKHLPAGLKELEKVLQFHHKRKSEWLCSRFILYHLLAMPKNQDLQVDEFGRKFSNTPKPVFYSISHSSPLVAVLESKLPSGVDIQMWRPNIKYLAHKFLHPDELDYCRNDVESIHAFWSAKEAMFKAFDGKGIEFKKDLRVFPNKHKPLHSGIGKVIKNMREQIYNLHFYRFKEGLMVISTPANE